MGRTLMLVKHLMVFVPIALGVAVELLVRRAGERTTSRREPSRSGSFA